MQNQNKHSDGEVHDISLRDYFAAKALTMQVSFKATKEHADEVARIAYLYADAMMKARVRK